VLRRPLRRLEAVLYVAIAALLAAVLLDRMLVYFALAERAAVETTVINTQSALYLRLAYDRLRGNLSREQEWTERSPFELAKMSLENYAGELDGPNVAGALARGQWAYDRGRRELVYAPRHRRGLAIQGEGDALRFRLVLPQDSRPPRLEPAVPYRWEP
jgi:hypothetical protein